jgi:hypothetical protein
MTMGIMDQLIDEAVANRWYEFKPDLSATLYYDAYNKFKLVTKKGLIGKAEYVVFQLDGTILKTTDKEELKACLDKMRETFTKETVESIRKHIPLQMYYDLVLKPQLKSKEVAELEDKMKQYTPEQEEKFSHQAEIEVDNSISWRKISRTRDERIVHYIDVKLPSGEEVRVKSYEILYFLEQLKKIFIEQLREQYYYDALIM